MGQTLRKQLAVGKQAHPDAPARAHAVGKREHSRKPATPQRQQEWPGSAVTTAATTAFGWESGDRSSTVWTKRRRKKRRDRNRGKKTWRCKVDTCTKPRRRAWWRKRWPMMAYTNRQNSVTSRTTEGENGKRRMRQGIEGQDRERGEGARIRISVY